MDTVASCTFNRKQIHWVRQHQWLPHRCRIVRTIHRKSGLFVPRWWENGDCAASSVPAPHSIELEVIASCLLCVRPGCCSAGRGVWTRKSHCCCLKCWVDDFSATRCIVLHCNRTNWRGVWMARCATSLLLGTQTGRASFDICWSSLGAVARSAMDVCRLSVRSLNSDLCASLCAFNPGRFVRLYVAASPKWRKHHGGNTRPRRVQLFNPAVGSSSRREHLHSIDGLAICHCYINYWALRAVKTCTSK